VQGSAQLGRCSDRHVGAQPEPAVVFGDAERHQAEIGKSRPPRPPVRVDRGTFACLRRCEGSPHCLAKLTDIVVS
jgi:hypothetical protein